MEGEWPGKDLQAAVVEPLDRLDPNRSFFEKVHSEGGATEFFVGWFLDGRCGGVFDCGLLARIADLKINLSLDVYPPDSPLLNPGHEWQRNVS